MKKTTITLFSIFTFLFLFNITLKANDEPDQKDSKTEGELTFTVRTVSAGGNYSPKHILAIWIEDMDGFVKTRKAMANQRIQYLYTWKAASNFNVVDAITGSTLNSHQTHTVTWDCTDLDGNLVPDGDYTIWVEFTEAHAQGPLSSHVFTKGENSQNLTPPDETYFKDIEIVYEPLISIVEENIEDIVNIYPNPGNGTYFINTELVDISSIKIYDYSGKLLKAISSNLSNGNNIIELDLTDQPNGLYFIEISTDNKKLRRKILKV